MIRTSFALILMAAISNVCATAGEALAPERKRPVTDRPNLGVQFQTARPGADSESLVVNYVYPGSAAQEMGLQSGDAILEVNGAKVRGQAAFIRDLQLLATGEKLEFMVLRGSGTIQVRGAMGSFQKTRRAFLEHCRKEIIGKRFSTVSELTWPNAINGIEGLKGKVGVLVSIDGCKDCVQGNWKRYCMRWDELQKHKQDWVGMCGIYSDVMVGYQKSLENLRTLLQGNPVQFPVAVVHFPNDRLPLDSFGKEPLIQGHGVAIIDPEGKVLLLQVNGFEPDNPNAEFAKVLEELARMYAPQPGGPKADGAPAPGPKDAPGPAPAAPPAGPGR